MQCDVSINVCIIKVSVSIRTPLLNPEILQTLQNLFLVEQEECCLSCTFYGCCRWKAMNSEFPGWSGLLLSELCLRCPGKATLKLYFICPQVLVGKGPCFRIEISATKPTLLVSTHHKKQPSEFARSYFKDGLLFHELPMMGSLVLINYPSKVINSSHYLIVSKNQ